MENQQARIPASFHGISADKYGNSISPPPLGNSRNGKLFHGISAESGRKLVELDQAVLGPRPTAGFPDRPTSDPVSRSNGACRDYTLPYSVKIGGQGSHIDRLRAGQS